MGVAFKWATSQNLEPKYLSVQCTANSEPLPLLLYLILTQMGHHCYDRGSRIVSTMLYHRLYSWHVACVKIKMGVAHYWYAPVGFGMDSSNIIKNIV